MKLIQINAFFSTVELTCIERRHYFVERVFIVRIYVSVVRPLAQFCSELASKA